MTSVRKCLGQISVGVERARRFDSCLAVRKGGVFGIHGTGVVTLQRLALDYRKIARTYVS